MKNLTKLGVRSVEKYVGAKLHGLRVTDAKLDYHGSITIDADFCREVGIKPLEYVEIWEQDVGRADQHLRIL